MKTTFFLLLLMLSGLQGYGQTCGTVVTQSQIDYQEALSSELTRSMDFAQGIIDIPVQFHVVRSSDGQGGISVEVIKRQFELLNERYIHANIRFVQKTDIHYIDDDRFANFRMSLEKELAEKHDIANIINIYCIEDIGGYYGYSYHPDDDRANRVVMGKQGLDNSSTLSHEMGHFFGLYHTHGKGLSISEPMEPIDRNADYNNNGISDCYELGDNLCDTPADPNMGSQKYRDYCLETCELSSEIPAKGGDYYQPSITNIMCYNQYPDCRSVFTKEQYTRIAQTARNERRKLILDQMPEGTAVAGKVSFRKNNREPMPLSLDVNLYRFDDIYREGDAFTFSVENLSETDLYLYIINMDAEKDVVKVFPMEKDEHDPLIGAGKVVSPLGKDWLIHLDDTAGKEYTCLLFAQKPLNPDAIVARMQRSRGTFSQRLYKVLGTRLLPLHNVNYLSGKEIHFNGRLKKNEILPVMLEMNRR